MSKTLLAIGVSCAMMLYGGDAERLEELERICAFVPCDDLRVQEIIPMPHDIIEKYQISTNQLIADLKTVATRYALDEQDMIKRRTRSIAVANIGKYSGTNELAFLETIMTNGSDYAQQCAIGASIIILKHSPELIGLERKIVANTAICDRLKAWTCYQLLYMCNEEMVGNYIDDPAQHARIAAFFVEQAGANRDLAITMDKNACELNPWYRHSQLRRDNLARLRPVGLTGKRAEIYNAAQQDAACEK